MQCSVEVACSTWDQITEDNTAVLQLMNVAEVEYPLCLKGLVILDIINIIEGPVLPVLPCKNNSNNQKVHLRIEAVEFSQT